MDSQERQNNCPVPQNVINRRTPIGICCQFERRGLEAGSIQPQRVHARGDQDQSDHRRPREVVDKLMKKANPVWQVILGLSRYGGLRTPSETLSLPWNDIDWELNRMSIPEPKVEHHEGRGIRSCPIFPELLLIFDEAFEIFGDKSEYVVAAPQYRAAASTKMGWKNANLLTELRIEN